MTSWWSSTSRARRRAAGSSPGSTGCGRSSRSGRCRCACVTARSPSAPPSSGSSRAANCSAWSIATWRCARCPAGASCSPTCSRRSSESSAGDTVTLEVLEGKRPVRDVVVAAVSHDILGSSATMALPALHALLGEGATLSGAYLAVDRRLAPQVYRDAQADAGGERRHRAGGRGARVRADDRRELLDLDHDDGGLRLHHRGRDRLQRRAGRALRAGTGAGEPRACSASPAARYRACCSASRSS